MGVKPMGVRYYTYASAAKIDMLYNQIPPKLLDRFVGELKLDIKVLSVSLARRESDQTLYSKLSVVERYLSEEVEVGSVTEPTTWFTGRMPLRSGVWKAADDGLLYFGGLQDGVQVALIGSSHHRIGQGREPDSISVSYSGLPALVSILYRDEPDARPRHARGISMPDDEAHLAHEVFDFASSLTGFPESSEFLARRLFDKATTDGGTVKRVLIGTPLYVALTGD
jgi:hypothetical protein